MSRRSFLAFAPLALCACNAILGIGDFSVAGDGGPPGDGNQICLGSLAQVCIDPPPDGAVFPMVVDTGSDCPLVVTPVNGSGELCVFAARALTLANATLRAIGPRPLVLAATDTIELLNATIDVSSPAGPVGQPGAGADAFECGGLPDGQSDASGAGGGAGGGFGNAGGEGGKGAVGAPGAIGGSTQAVGTVRGGCPGSSGGSSSGSTGSPGGHGGGAIYLVAGTRVTIDAVSNVFAAGGAGAGGQDRAGPGGGGSGGLIAIEAPMLDLAGILAANGGGGGGGADLATGQAGKDGTTTQFDQEAPGGVAESTGGDGGAGGALNREFGAPGNSAGGSGGSGGGGGGAVGAIWLAGTPIGGMPLTSPTAMVFP